MNRLVGFVVEGAIQSDFRSAWLRLGIYSSLRQAEAVAANLKPAQRVIVETRIVPYYVVPRRPAGEQTTRESTQRFLGPSRIEVERQMGRKPQQEESTGILLSVVRDATESNAVVMVPHTASPECNTGRDICDSVVTVP
jgi:single-stranded DNA-binding protein